MEAQTRQPLVAVVTPVYNGSPFLSAALACVQAQTYGNLVHIVLDNASTDDTPQVIACAANGRVPILARRNSSLLPRIDNWNAAVAMVPSEAKYFRVLCADDLMTPNAIEQMVALAEANPEVGLVGCLQGFGGTHTNPARIDGGGLPAWRNVFDGRWLVKTYLMRLHGALSPTHMLIERRFLDEETPFYRKGQESFDVEVCLRIMRGCQYGFVHDVIAWTRQHDLSSTIKVSLPFQTYIAEWLAWIDLFGPSVMTPPQLIDCRRAHLRHYFRRLLLWRFKQRNKALFDRHIALLAERGVRPTAWHYAEALGEWGWLAIQNRRDEAGAARALREAVWTELVSPRVQQDKAISRSEASALHSR